MRIYALFVVAFAMLVSGKTFASVDKYAIAPSFDDRIMLSGKAKEASMQRAVTAAMQCVARVVPQEAGYSPSTAGTAFGDLIAKGVQSCVSEIREMIALSDRYFGYGSGEEYFAGPFLNWLPQAVYDQIHLNVGR